MLKTGGASTRDDFRWPAAVSYTNESGTDPSANASDNIHQEGTVVANRAKWEMEGAEAVATLYDGASQFGGLVPGGTFTITSQPASAYDNTYAVRSVTHHATDDTWLNQRRRRVLFQPVHRVPLRDDLARADHHAAPAHERHLHRVGDGTAERPRNPPSTCRAARRSIPTTWRG